MRHCVCIGAWSLYMTREADPAWTTSEASPFCDAIPLSALTSRYIGKWKDWNGIPANIAHGASQLLAKCVKHRSGPPSAAPSTKSACFLAQAFKDLQKHESSLNHIKVDAVLKDAGFSCAGVKISTLTELSSAPSPSSSGGSGAMPRTTGNGNGSPNNGHPPTSSAFIVTTRLCLLAVILRFFV